MLNRPELAAFLRTRRERLRPRDVGLPDAQRRRTPGLRRQEVAQLDRRLITYVAVPGSATQAAFRRLAALTGEETGTSSMMSER
jgi:hypothetical protein